MTKKELMAQYDILKKAVELIQPEMQKLREQNARLAAQLDAATRAEIADAQSMRATDELLPGSDIETRTNVGARSQGRPCAVCGKLIPDEHGRFILPIGHVHQACKGRNMPLPKEWSEVPVLTSVGASASDVPGSVSSSTSNTAIAVLVIGVGAALIFMSSREKKEKPWLR